jgi:sugar phosphate isomerase/epimerase
MIKVGGDSMKRQMRVGMPVLMEHNTVEKNIQLAKELGLDFVELNINIQYCLPSEEFRHELIRLKKKYDIDFTMHYYDMVDISSTSKHYRNYLYTELSEIGKYLENIVDKMVIHIEPGAFMTIKSVKNYVYSEDPNYVPRTINTAKTIQEVLETFGISMVLENVPIHPFMEPLYKALHENDFYFCYDIGHDVIYNDYLFKSFKEKYGLRFKHMHMHNVYNKKDHQKITHGELIIDDYLAFVNDNKIDVVIEVKDEVNLRESVTYLNEYFKRER